MTEKGHWPFGAEEPGHDARNSEHMRELSREKELQARQAMLQQRQRFNRLIVGGRAHGRKPGLS